MSYWKPIITVHTGSCINVMRGMELQGFDAIVTDPPYGTGARRRSKRGDMTSLTTLRAQWDVWDVAWVYHAAPLLGPGGKLVSFCPVQLSGDLVEAAARCGLPFRCSLHWLKPNPAPHFDGRLSNALEHMMVFGGGTLNSHLDSNVFTCASDQKQRVKHENHKPVDLMRWVIRLVSPQRGWVLDPFCGSGSTLVAAALEERNAVGVELDPDYAAAALAAAKAVAQPRLDFSDAQ